MFPTFFIPGGRRYCGGVIYEKTATLNRADSATLVMDPDLVFTAAANKKYRIYGEILNQVTYHTASTGISFILDHAGDTVGFNLHSFSSGLDSLAPAYYAAQNGASYWRDIDSKAVEIAIPRNGLSTGLSYTMVDALLTTGATGGACGISWRTYGNSGGFAQLYVGSRLIVKEV